MPIPAEVLNGSPEVQEAWNAWQNVLATKRTNAGQRRAAYRAYSAALKASRAPVAPVWAQAIINKPQAAQPAFSYSSYLDSIQEADGSWGHNIY